MMEVVEDNLDKISAKQSLPWVEKYRPSSLADLIAHEDIISIRKLNLLVL